MDRLTKTYSVFDCDAHINDPVGIWDHVPESKKELVRNTYWRGDSEAWLNGDQAVMGGGNGHFPGYNPICIAGPQMNKKIMRKLNSMPLTADQKTYLHHDGAIDPAARLIEMDLMGIDQVLVIPTMVIMHVPFATNAEGVAAFCEAYNDFVVDWCSVESSRLFAAAFLPAQDAAYTVKEIERAAGLGLPVGLIRPIDAHAKYPNAAAPSMMANGAYDAVFKAFEETGMVLGMHTFPAPNYPHPLGVDFLASPGELFNRAGVDSQTFSFVHEMQVWLSQVLLTGLLDRYPKLKMAVFESNAEWLPYTLKTCDRLYKLYARERGAHSSSDRLPSEAFHDQCVISFESDEVGVFRQWEHFQKIGIWASDAYHHDGADSWSAMRNMTESNVPEEVQADLLGAAVAQSIHHDDHQSSGNWIWSNNGERLQVNYSGTFDFTDDDADVRQVSPGGYLKISDGAWFGRHSVEIRERAGELERRYYVNGSERPFEPDGRIWLHDNLPRFVRNTGIGAPSRVARFLKSGGVSAVMGEISRVEGTYVKGLYFRELFKQATLTPDQYRQAMTQASHEMHGSDYELASLLISIADRLPNDETSRDAYFTAASGISSDYELRRVYSTMLKKGPVSPQTLAGILGHSSSIHSDYELSELLRQIMSQQSLDDRNRAAYFRAVATVGSDYERHRVLKAAIERGADTATVEAALGQAASMRSDYEAGTFLQEVLKQSGVEGSLRAPFFRVVNHLSSGYEKGRVLQSVVRKPDVSADTLREVLRSSKGMSGYELSQLLIAVAGARTLTGELRDAYLDAADHLSGYEQGQVLTALVKSERRK